MLPRPLPSVLLNNSSALSVPPTAPPPVLLSSNVELRTQRAADHMSCGQAPCSVCTGASCTKQVPGTVPCLCTLSSSPRAFVPIMLFRLEEHTQHQLIGSPLCFPSTTASLWQSSQSNHPPREPISSPPLSQTLSQSAPRLYGDQAHQGHQDVPVADLVVTGLPTHPSLPLRPVNP